MGYFISVDLGGTQIRAALFRRDSLSPVRVERTPTRADVPGVYERLEALIASVWPAEGSVRAIGVASPGPLNPHSGVIIATPNIKEWRDFPLTEKLARRFAVPVFLDNDANMACLGEWKFGAGQGHENVLYLTISTGIGGGVIAEGKLLQGFHGLAAELGHTTVLPDGPLCGCGKRGHVEAIASGTGIAAYVRGKIAAGSASSLENKKNFNAHDVADAAQQGDALALEAFEQAGFYLGLAVANFLAAFDPSIVIFGGGVSRSGNLLFEPFERSLRQHCFSPAYLENLQIANAALGDEAGLLGALALAILSVPDN